MAIVLDRMTVFRGCNKFEQSHKDLFNIRIQISTKGYSRSALFVMYILIGELNKISTSRKK